MNNEQPTPLAPKPVLTQAILNTWGLAANSAICGPNNRPLLRYPTLEIPSDVQTRFSFSTRNPEVTININ
jgi:hypothetical protein